MNTLTIRTLGFPWLIALVLTGLACLALAGQEVVPHSAWRPAASSPTTLANPPLPGAAPADSTATSGSPAELLAALTAHEHGVLREQLTAIRALLAPPSGDPDVVAISQARARLAALIATQDTNANAASPAASFTSLLARIDTTMNALRQNSSAVAPSAIEDNILLKIATVMALLAAVLALTSGPLALAPVHLLCASLADAAIDAARGVGRSVAPGSVTPVGAAALWGVNRRDVWGHVSRHAANLLDRTPAVKPTTQAAPTEDLRETAAAMARMLAESGQELARMRGEAGEAVNNAVMLGARLADAVLDAEARLEARVQRGMPTVERYSDSTGAADRPASPQGSVVDTSALWSAASAHADRLEEAATRALAAATVLPAAAERIEHAIAGLDRMAATVAANSDGLADLAARAGAAAAMLPDAASRIEQAASGLDGVTSRTASAASMLPQAAQIIAQASAELGRAAEVVANNAAGLHDAVARQGEVAASLPHIARRIETAVAGLDRTAAAMDDATDHARIANRAAAATATLNETSQRALAEAAQSIGALGASLGEQLPSLTFQIADATEQLRGGAKTLLQSAERVEGTSRAIATLSAGAESVQAAMAGATHRMATISEQLPAVALQIANAGSDLDRSADAVGRAADRVDSTSRAVGALTSGVETAQAVLSGAVQRMTSLGEELPALAFQIADATQNLDRTAERLGAAVDGGASVVREAASSVSDAALAQTNVAEALRQAVAHAAQTLPVMTDALALQVNALDTHAASHREEMSAQAQRIAAVSEALELRANGLDQMAERMAEKAAEAARAQETTDARQASLAESVRQIAGLATTVSDSLPPLTGRISEAVDRLEDSAGAISMIGASAGEALPAVAARIDEALAGLDSTVHLLSEAARAAAASVAESSGTQSALAQTVQCMASVGEALPSLAMRLEGTLGALDRSTDTIVAAANDVAEAGRAITATATGEPLEEGDRRPAFGPPRPVPDASMRRLQSVASALALASNGGRG
jgi:ABC-type transporter Mla subunit MlaD